MFERIKEPAKNINLFKKNLNLKIDFSFFILVGLLALSWFYLSNFKINPEEEMRHSLLKSKFEEVLSELIEKKHPEVSHISFNKIWTKKTKDLSQVEIYFNYTLKSESAESELEGSALLSLSQENVWQIQNFQIEKSRLDFSEPIVIKATLNN